ncbi:MAG: glycoside hydrolase family 13 protein [Firmicutes bacterium]|nr:glycoside hydrolase family 13 protein [Bacillota bacterium]
MEGIRKRLDYLDGLGVTALYLTPVFKAPSNHKYDTTDYLQVDPHLGGNGALKRLVLEAHQRGMRVVLDGVFNHTGDSFWAFRDVLRRGANSPYKDWYYFDSFPVRRRPPNYRACGGAHFLPKLNVSNPAVREYLLNVARYWIQEADIDGWRLDVPWEVPHEFWREFRSAVKEVRPDAYLIGEAWGDPGPWLQGDEFDGATHYRLRELLLRFIVQQAIDAATFDRELAALRNSCPGSFRRSMLTLLGSHDTPRVMTMADRRSAPVQALFAFLFAFEGVPLIYYGDEIGLEGGRDPDCRRCMLWEESTWDRDLAKLVQTLSRLRKEHPALRKGGFSAVLTQERAYAFLRIYGNDRVLVAINAGFQPESLFLNEPSGENMWYDELSHRYYHSDQQNLLTIKLPPSGVAILTPGGSRGLTLSVG